MTIYQIECFVILSKYLNFTKAAEIMNITQPAFSRSISSLESELDVVLFNRSTRNVKLTKSGKIFLDEANEILKHYYASLLKIKSVHQSGTSFIRIGLLKEQLNDTLTKTVNIFRNKYPHVNIILSEYSNSKILKALQTGEIDIAFTISPGIFTIPNIEWKCEMILELAVIIPVRHPLASKENVDISDLVNETFIIFDEDENLSPYNIVQFICSENNINPIATKMVTCINSVMTLVECGEGICIVPLSFISQFKQNVLFKSISNNRCQIERGFAWIKDNKNPCLPLFIDSIVTN